MKKENLASKVILRICFLLALCVVRLLNVQGQTNQTTDEPFDSPRGPLKCEEWYSYLGETYTKWEKNKELPLIIIAKPGVGESRRLNLKRIKTLRDYLSNPRYPVKTVFAEGERAEDFGVIELYVEGKLFYSLPVSRKENIMQGCQNP